MTGSQLSAAALRRLEAIVDDRLELAVGDADEAVVRELESHGLLAADVREAAVALVRSAAASRPAEWTSGTVTQGEILDAFARHCRDDLEDVEIADQDEVRLVARWRSETSRIELRSGTLGIERLAGGAPTLVLADLEHAGGALVEAYLDDAGLRGSLAILDLARLERLGAVRSSVFVYLDWFLRERYGVKVLPAPAFTQGLLARGIISLGMG